MPIKTVKKATVAKKEHEEFGGVMENMAKASEQGTKDMLKDLERLEKRNDLLEYFEEIKHKYSKEEIKEIRKKIKNEEITKKKQIPKPDESSSSSSESEEEKPKKKITKTKGKGLSKELKEYLDQF
jgi:hypothetical protein